LTRFHQLHHLKEMGKHDIEALLSYLAVERHVAASTQNQALNAILFLYREVLEIQLPWLDQAFRAKRPQVEQKDQYTAFGLPCL